MEVQCLATPVHGEQFVQIIPEDVGRLRHASGRLFLNRPPPVVVEKGLGAKVVCLGDSSTEGIVLVKAQDCMTALCRNCNKPIFLVVRIDAASIVAGISVEVARDRY